MRSLIAKKYQLFLYNLAVEDASEKRKKYTVFLRLLTLINHNFVYILWELLRKKSRRRNLLFLISFSPSNIRLQLFYYWLILFIFRCLFLPPKKYIYANVCSETPFSKKSYHVETNWFAYLYNTDFYWKVFPNGL